MSLTAVRPYFRTRMNALGYLEWTDGFNTDNIPSTIINNSYHVRLGDAIGEKINSNNLDFSVAASLVLFKGEYRDVGGGIDSVIIEAEAIIASCMSVSNRLATAGIINVKFNRMAIEPFNALENDNIIRVTLDFEVIYSVCLS